MNPLPAFAKGFSRLVGSAKVQASAFTAAAAYVTARYAAADLPPDKRAWLWLAFVAGGFVLAKSCVDGWAAEDAADKTTPAPAATTASPSPQVNVAVGDSANANVEGQPATPAPLDLFPTPVAGKKIVVPRSAKALPLILLPLLALAAGGCQADPSYATYREGMQAVVAPVTRQFDDLMTDAVAAKLRTPTEQAIERAEVKAINDLYAKSRQTTPAASQPATAGK